MHAAIRRICLADPIRRGELARRMADTVLPEIQAIPGNSACYVVACDGAEIYLLALFDGQAEAEVGATRIDAWVHRHAAPLVDAKDAGSVVLGEVHVG